MKPDHKVSLVGIAGTPNDFLLSPYVLKCFAHQDPALRDRAPIRVHSYPYLPPEQVEEGAGRIVADVLKAEPRAAGFACYVWNMDAVLRAARELKRRDPGLTVVFGGPEISADDIAAGRFDGEAVDFLVHGEGEKPLGALLASLAGGAPHDAAQIAGLAYRRDGRFVCNPPDVIEHLDRVPSAYLTGCVPDDVLARPAIRANVETQRGCNFRCAYCLYHKDFPGIRYRDADTVVEEMALVDRQGIRMCRIVDANFISSAEFAKRILRGMIGRRLRLHVFAEILPQYVDEELARLFGEYLRCAPGNFLMMGVGLQSLNRESLKVIRRQIPLRYFERAFELLLAQNVTVKTDLILGLPRETRETYLEAIEYVAEKARSGTHFVSLAVLRILPGSELVQIAGREGLALDRRDGHHFVYETPTLPREHMIECQRLNAAAFRVLSSVHMQKGPAIRNLYFEAKDARGVRHVEILSHLAREFFDYLRNRGTDYTKPDFPNAEDYASKNVRTDIPDDWLAERLVALKRGGLPPRAG